MKKITIICFSLIVSLTAFSQNDDSKPNKNEDPDPFEDLGKAFEEMGKSFEIMGEGFEKMALEFEQMFNNDSLRNEMEKNFKEFNEYFENLDLDEKDFNVPDFKIHMKDMGEKMRLLFKDFRSEDFKKNFEELEFDFDSLENQNKSGEKKEEGSSGKKLKKI